MASIAFTDEWGEVIDRPEHDTIEIRWFDSTATMTGNQVQRLVVSICRRS